MPDVFILGFTKCATTSMYNQLMKHDAVSNTKRKEPHFHFSKIMGNRFDGPADNDTVQQMFVTDPEQYKILYEPGKLSIDGSAMSIEDPRVLEEMNSQFPDAKYIIMLRKPVERAFSAYSHLIRDARETRTFREALEHELNGARADYMPIWHNIKSSRYVDAVQRARKLLGDRLKVVSYRDYARSNHPTMDSIVRFIGLKPIDWQSDYANRSGAPRSKMFQKVLMRQSAVKTLFVKTLPEKYVTSIKRYLVERNTGAKPTLNVDDRLYFESCIADELCKINPNTPDSALLTMLYRS
jgi:hypothetical protein